ncbi:MAG: energy transducer TonB [Bacteroidetes bacterium]|nr:energy transducer TonB [Bacteroidota bacterium]MBK8659595.1 energy transducer TonB [Bacteroidota bacterium]
MKTNYQNTSLLDMVFENRNKLYGAYVLRQQENQRLQLAVGISMGSTLLVLLVGFMQAAWQHKTPYTTTPGVHDIVDIVKVLDDEPVKITPETPQQPKAKASVRNTTMNVVAEQQATTDTFATAEQLRHFDSGINTNLQADANNLGQTDGTGDEDDLDAPVVENTPPPSFIVHAEVMPEYEGGDAALLRYLAQETVYPEREKELEIEGKALVRFIVNKDGSVADAEILRSDSPGFSKEAIRVVRSLKKFKPGMQAGREVRVQLVLPFHFRLNR